MNENNMELNLLEDNQFTDITGKSEYSDSHFKTQQTKKKKNKIG